MKAPEKVVLAVGVVALAAIAANALLAHLARLQAEKCASIPVPTTLQVLEKEFGSPSSRIERGGGKLEVFFEPSPFYIHYASGSVAAMTSPPSTRVSALHCGEL